MERDGPRPGPALVPAESYAAEAMAADMDPWIKFNTRNTPHAEFEAWLENNRPSQVNRYGASGGSNVGWIAVYGPSYCSNTGDVDGLQEDWERLLASGRPVSFATVRELALNHGVLSGKWLIHLDSGFKVDHAWEGIARTVVEGSIPVAKVSPRCPAPEDKHVICVYTHAFTDQDEVVRLEAAIRATGVKCPLSFKPDVYTYLGIYRNNRWKLCPTIYESKFDLESVPRRSHITNKVTGAEVT
ncbi:CK068 protein, partial [Amia calva]|nr:CK068 protein [Amia calva]